MKKKLLKILQERELVDKVTPGLEEILENPISLYAGFDPTADSLHLGNLLVIVVMRWFLEAGHSPIALVGGATGMVGDPSGKSVERNLLDDATLKLNVKGIEESLRVVQDKMPIVDNRDWFEDFSFIEFLREIGKYFRMSTLLARESVKSRISSEEGLSYTEFSYQLLQAYDFLHLYDQKKVMLQIGGSDQWGNIVSGIELVRKKRGEGVHGLTLPLLVRSDGKKFGKSEEGTIWLNEKKLSCYDFYQYLYRLPDADVIGLLKRLTFVALEEIKEVEQQMQKSSYQANSAQRLLAKEVTLLVHGKEGLKKAEVVTDAAKPGSDTVLDAKTLRLLAEHTPYKAFAFEACIGKKIVDLLVEIELTESKGHAKRLILNRGVYLNNQALDSIDQCVEKKDLIEDQFLLFSLGKKKKFVVEIKKNHHF